MSEILEGVAVRFYRGIGPNTQYISPFSNLNLFVGSNNSGKSIVLNLLATKLKGALSSASHNLNGTEVYRGTPSGNPFIGIGRKTEKVIETIELNHNSSPFHPRSGRRNAEGNHPTLASEILRICNRISVNGCLWFNIQDSGQLAIHHSLEDEDLFNLTDEWEELCRILAGVTGGSRDRNWIPKTLSAICSAALYSVPTVHIIPAKRIFGGSGQAFDDLSGKGLIDHLAAIQNPDYHQREELKKFEAINTFLREVTGKPDARIEVPSSKEHLLVHMDEKVLPLSALGTGIHEVILIASFCTIHDGGVMCIEEPEIHLHPLLQKKLINYLVTRTSNQYFIATHSSAFIDTPGASVFHVSNDGTQSSIRPMLTKAERHSILDDLGYRASDLLQSNMVIWVEGPSDRLYLRHWISEYDDELKEGIHYSIMFYGGSLISHLSASDEFLEEFIKLRDLNRNLAIVIDSDREFDGAPLKPHAARIVEEMNSGNGMVWVTDGREVENYVPSEKIQGALKEIHSRTYLAAAKLGKFDHSFYFYRKKSSSEGGRELCKLGDKVGVAGIVCAQSADLDVLDLRTRVGELVVLIRKANGIFGTPQPLSPKPLTNP
jgi:AAA ATPase domain